MGNKPGRAREHFYGLREAKPDLVGIALYDRLDFQLVQDSQLTQVMWKRREIENYLATRRVLRAFAEQLGKEQHGDLFMPAATKHTDAAIEEVSEALRTLGKPDPFGPDAKVSDEFLDPVFRKFFIRLGLPEATMRKTDFHTLAPLLPADEIDGEVREVLDRIVEVASRAKPVGGTPA